MHGVGEVVLSRAAVHGNKSEVGLVVAGQESCTGNARCKQGCIPKVGSGVGSGSSQVSKTYHLLNKPLRSNTILSPSPDWKGAPATADSAPRIRTAQRLDRTLYIPPVEQTSLVGHCACVFGRLPHQRSRTPWLHQLRCAVLPRRTMSTTGGHKICHTRTCKKKNTHVKHNEHGATMKEKGNIVAT